MWNDDKPWLVRMPMGAGCITWVAQDLGAAQLKGSRDFVSAVGWSRIWDKIFDWPNESTHVPISQSRSGGAYDSGNVSSARSIELGRATLAFMDLKSTSAALIGIAVLFFIIYWVAAGPGSFLVLSRKNRSHYSWIAFAVLALAATGLTWIITKLVLRGDPKLQHVTVVRQVAGEPAIIQSGFGLYIPRDGAQTIEIKDTAAGRSSYVTPFSIHPAFNVDDIQFPASQDYYMPVLRVQEQGKDVAEPTKISVPYRSTLKKFQAVWTGEFSKGISGDIKLTDNVPYISGTLTNNTGAGLRSVYIAFVHPAVEVTEGKFTAQEYIYYVSYWEKDTSIKLDDFTTAKGARAIKADESIIDSSDYKVVKRYFGRVTPDRLPTARNENSIMPELNSWTDFWYTQMRARGKNSFGDQSAEETDPLKAELFPILSFYGRLPVPRNVIKEYGTEAIRPDRFDLLRRGNRNLDLSSAISAGQLAVIAVSENDQQHLPFPMEVEGDRIDKSDRCNGIVYYQFVLTIDRAAYNKPTATQPTTKPATRRVGSGQ
jgi:hypothetical protein